MANGFKNVLMACVFAITAAAVPAHAQNWPAKPITLIVANPPGGPADLFCRVMADAFRKRLGQPVIVENRPGASGSVAMQQLQKSAADGYTLFGAVATGHTLGPLTRKALYRPLDDFTFIAKVVAQGYVLFVSADVPANSVQELVALSKARPGKLNYGTIAGAGIQMEMERFKREAGVDIVAVPYVGAAPIVNAVVSNVVQVAILNTVAVESMLKAGRLRVLATPALTRVKSLPDVPTLGEAGYGKGYMGGSVYGLVGPAGMQAPLVNQIYAATAAAVADPDVKHRLNMAGFEVDLLDGVGYRQYLQRERAENENILKALKLNLD